MTEDVRTLAANAICGWHHNHNGGMTPCRSALMEADALIGYLGTHHHHIVPNNVSFDINGDDITVFVNDVLIFEGKRSQVTWEHPDKDVRDVMQQIWEQGQDDGVQEYVVNGVPAHMTTHMSLRDLMTPPGLREDAWQREREKLWQDPPDVNRRMFDLLSQSIKPWIGPSPAEPTPLTHEMLREAMDRAQVYIPPMLPDYYRVHVTPPSPRAWADAHVTAHPNHIVLIAGPADTQTQCFYPEGCKATMWNDPDYADKHQRAMAALRHETEHNIYRQGVESSDDPGE